MTLVYQSTRDANNTVTASQAILQGLATDGGLFTPISYPQVELDFAKLKDASYQEVAKLILSAFLDDFTRDCSLGETERAIQFGTFPWFYDCFQGYGLVYPPTFDDDGSEKAWFEK